MASSIGREWLMAKHRALAKAWALDETEAVGQELAAVRELIDSEEKVTAFTDLVREFRQEIRMSQLRSSGSVRDYHDFDHATASVFAALSRWARAFDDALGIEGAADE